MFYICAPIVVEYLAYNTHRMRMLIILFFFTNILNSYFIDKIREILRICVEYFKYVEYG